MNSDERDERRPDAASRATDSDHIGTAQDRAGLVLRIQRIAGNRAASELMARRAPRGMPGSSPPSTQLLQRDAAGKPPHHETLTVLRVTVYVDANTVVLDLSTIEGMDRASRHPAGKGHALSLPYDSDLLKGVAKSIIEDGIPPKGPHPVATPVTPGDRRDPSPVPPPPR